MSPGWSIVRHGEGEHVRCEALALPGVAHAFGTRSDDCSTASGASLASRAGCGSSAAPRLRQVHGSNIVRSREVDAGGVEADAVWENSAAIGGSFLAVRTADCVPILIASIDGETLAAVHAGWRGTAARIAALSVERLAGSGCSPDRLVAAIGPSIGPCCYPVSSEVVERVREASGEGPRPLAERGPAGLHLDLREANRRQLSAVGVPAASIAVAPWCTGCEDALFFSFRREGEAAGRQLSLIGPADPRP